MAKTYEDKMPLTNALYMYDLKTKETKSLSDQDLSIRFAYFLDQDHVGILASDRKTYGLNQNPIFYKINIESGQRSLFATDYDKSSGSSVGSDCRLGSKKQFKALDGHLYFVTTEDENAPLNHLSPQGEITKLTHFSGSVDDLDVHEKGLAFIAMKDQNLNEIYLLENKEEKKITDFNTWVQDAYSIIVPEDISSTSGDGTQIYGWVMKPLDYDPKKKYPSILNIHGGPKPFTEKFSIMRCRPGPIRVTLFISVTQGAVTVEAVTSLIFVVNMEPLTMRILWPLQMKF